MLMDIFSKLRYIRCLENADNGNGNDMNNVIIMHIHNEDHMKYVYTSTDNVSTVSR